MHRPLLHKIAALASVLALPLFVQACTDNANQMPQGSASNAVAADGGKPIAVNNDLVGATPMRDRVAVIGLLNKRNGLTQDLKMKPGEALRVGNAIVRLRACETAAPWEEMQETGAFVQLDVRVPKEEKWLRVFSGWLFRERPDRNVVQHPVYDVWVKSCTMTWPDTGPDTVKAGAKSGANAASASGPGPADNSADSSASETSESASPSNN